MRIILNTALAIAIVGANACSPTGRTPDEACANAALPDAVLGRIIDADNARDIEKALDGYADDIVWLPPARPPLSGIDAIRDSYEKMYSTYQPSLSINIDETLSDQRLAVVRGATLGTLTPQDGGAIEVNDNFLAVLKCDRGNWRVARMIWGPAAPAT